MSTFKPLLVFPMLAKVVESPLRNHNHLSVTSSATQTFHINNDFPIICDQQALSNTGHNRSSLPSQIIKQLSLPRSRKGIYHLPLLYLDKEKVTPKMRTPPERLASLLNKSSMYVWKSTQNDNFKKEPQVPPLLNASLPDPIPQRTICLMTREEITRLLKTYKHDGKDDMELDVKPIRQSLQDGIQYRHSRTVSALPFLSIHNQSKTTSNSFCINRVDQVPMKDQVTKARDETEIRENPQSANVINFSQKSLSGLQNNDMTTTHSVENVQGETTSFRDKPQTVNSVTKSLPNRMAKNEPTFQNKSTVEDINKTSSSVLLNQDSTTNMLSSGNTCNEVSQPAHVTCADAETCTSTSQSDAITQTVELEVSNKPRNLGSVNVSTVTDARNEETQSHKTFGNIHLEKLSLEHSDNVTKRTDSCLVSNEQLDFPLTDGYCVDMLPEKGSSNNQEVVSELKSLDLSPIETKECTKKEDLYKKLGAMQKQLQVIENISSEVQENFFSTRKVLKNLERDSNSPKHKPQSLTIRDSPVKNNEKLTCGQDERLSYASQDDHKMLNHQTDRKQSKKNISFGLTETITLPNVDEFEQTFRIVPFMESSSSPSRNALKTDFSTTSRNLEKMYKIYGSKRLPRKVLENLQINHSEILQEKSKSVTVDDSDTSSESLSPWVVPEDVRRIMYD